MRYHIERLPHSVVFAKSIEDLYKCHKFNFTGTNIGGGFVRHTFLDWFLSPVERFSIDKAEVKENYIDIPGSNGGLDLTESLTGYPLYNYIEGSFEFNILNERKLPILNNKGEQISEVDISWETLNRDIRSFLNGKQMYMLLEDDPSWYYYGRFSVERYNASESMNSKIKISYKVYPFKRLIRFKKNLDEYKNIYFDSIALFDSEVNNLYASFWIKRDFLLYPVASISEPYVTAFLGEGPYDLPCGNESTAITFIVDKQTNAYTPVVKFTSFRSGVSPVLEKIKTQAGNTPQSTKIRRVTLTNTNAYGYEGVDAGTVKFSDNDLTLYLPFPDAFSDSAETIYKAGDAVSYISYQENIKWILVANEDTTGGTMDLTQWSADLAAMNIKEFTTEEGYNAGDLAAVKDTWDNEVQIRLYKALVTMPAGSFNPENWELYNSPTKQELYTPIKVTVEYDIGVM